MRQASVLDVGCHSALLTIVRRRPDSLLEPVFSRKVRLRLHETLDHKGRLDPAGVESVEQAVAEAVAANPHPHGPEVFAFATSVIRDAPNRDAIIASVKRTTGTRLRVLTGQEEARLAYVAARQWAEESGPLLVLDIGGGTLEIASGTGDRPRTVHSLPLGARRVTRDWLPGNSRPSPQRLTEIREHLRRSLEAVPGLPHAEPGTRVLACSKTFEQLARLAAARGKAPRAGRKLALPHLRTSVTLLAEAKPSRRGKLPGISHHRAAQSLAGALIAQTLMEVCGVKTAEICPWSTREGLLLEHLGVPPHDASGRSRLAG